MNLALCFKIICSLSFRKFYPSVSHRYQQNSMNTANIPFMSLSIMFCECKKVTPSNICFVYPLDSCSERTLFFDLRMWSDNDPCRKPPNYNLDFNLEFYSIFIINGNNCSIDISILDAPGTTF